MTKFENKLKQEFQKGYDKAQEETKAKVEKLKKLFAENRMHSITYIFNKIDEIFKETSEGEE